MGAVNLSHTWHKVNNNNNNDMILSISNDNENMGQSVCVWVEVEIKSVTTHPLNMQRMIYGFYCVKLFDFNCCFIAFIVFFSLW